MRFMQAIGGVLFATVLTTATPTTQRLPDASAPSATFFAVGDIIYHQALQSADLTAQLAEHLLNSVPGSLLLGLGDMCNDDGRPECYDRFEQSGWGKLRDRIRAVPGNHDYEHARATGSFPEFFRYFVPADIPERGYSALSAAGWRILLLNSEIMAKDPRHQLSPAGRAQLAWMEKELQQHAHRACVMTVYHRPPFTSGRHGGANGALSSWTDPLFHLSYRWGVDLSLAGHEHFFASLPALTPAGVVDRSFGVPSLIGGTGGAVMFPDPRQDQTLPRIKRVLRWAAADEVVLANTLGVMRLDLQPNAYRWQFVPVHPDPGRISPSGSGTCHDKPATSAGLP